MIFYGIMKYRFKFEWRTIMSFKTILQVVLLCTFSTYFCAYAQNTDSAYPKITIKSFTQEGDSTKESTEIINFQDRNQVIIFLDSIMGSKGKNFLSIQQQLNDLGISGGDLLALDSVFSQMSGRLNLAFKPTSPVKDKVVLGVMIDDFTNTNDLKIVHPVVSSIIPNSPAEHAGLLKNDIIFKLDNEEVNVLPDMVNIIKNKSDGDSLHIIYIREKDTLNTIAVLRVIQKDENWLTLLQQKMETVDSCLMKPSNPFCEKIIVQKSGPRLGVKVTELTDEARKDLKAKNGGVLITQVLPNSTAELMHLNINDVITALNGTQVKTVTELKSILESLPIPYDIEISYVRYGKNKKAKGTISEFSKAWDDNQLMNIIDLSKFFND